MKEHIITYETAKLLALIGFNESTDNLYQGKFLIDSIHGYDSDISAPTIYQLQEWLFLKHKIYVYVNPYYDIDNNLEYIYYIHDTSERSYNFPENSPAGYRDFLTPILALEAGLKSAIKHKLK